MRKSIQNVLSDHAEDLHDTLVDPRLASEREAQPLAHRHALEAFACLRVAAAVYEALVSEPTARVPEPGHAATDDDGEEPGLAAAVDASSCSGLHVDPVTVDRFREALATPAGPIRPLDQAMCSAAGCRRWVATGPGGGCREHPDAVVFIRGCEPKDAPCAPLQSVDMRAGWTLFNGEVLWELEPGPRPVRVTAQIRNPRDPQTAVDIVRVSTVVGSGREIDLALHEPEDVLRLEDAVRARARQEAS